jgi:hypothetical protein
MTPAEIAAIERACTRLILEFAKHNDDWDHEALADLFVADCLFARPLDPAHPYHGRDKVQAIFRDRTRRLTRHIMTNILITPLSPDEAKGTSYVTMMSAPDPDKAWPREGEGIFIGTFDDHFVNTPAGWKFKSRTGNVALYQGGQVPLVPVPSVAETGVARS